MPLEIVDNATVVMRSQDSPEQKPAKLASDEIATEEN
jgi:hypothetical protein